MLPRLRVPALLYAALGLALWPSPLFGLLHVEAATVVATASFFIGGLSATGLFRSGDSLRRVLIAQLGLLLIPWALLTATLVWRANCGYVLGCALFILYTIPSVVLAVSLAYALTGATKRWRRVWFVIAGSLIATIPVAFDLLLHPQLYTYNHVFGGILGPIYDEELAVRPGLFVFRGLTILWAIWLMMLGLWLRRKDGRGHDGAQRRNVGTWAFVTVVIALIYAFSVPLGINTSAGHIERALGIELDLGSAVIHYQAGSLTESELSWISDEHIYRYEQLREQLGVNVAESIHVYLYPDGDTRAALIGSRTTSVTPVWLPSPQIHMLAEEFTPDHYGHELAHVFAREFGMPVLHASLAVGLVEGLAVAVEPPDGLPEPRYQVAASLESNQAGLGHLNADPAEAVAHAMNPLGFWTGRGAVSYTTSGAFAGYLLDRFGAEKMRLAYRTADFREAFGHPLDELASAWEAELRTLQPDSEAVAIAMWRFAQPSLFERYCPHHLPRVVRLTRRAVEAEERGDVAEALRFYEGAIEADSTFAPALAGWARHLIGSGGNVLEPTTVLETRVLLRSGEIAEETDILLVGVLGDLYKSQLDSANAAAAYAEAFRRLPPYARDAKTVLLLRRGLSPDGLRAVLAPGDELERAEKLEALAEDEPALWFFAAAYRNRLGDARGALRAIRQLPTANNLGAWESDNQRQIVEQARLALLALYADSAGDYASALDYAGAAAISYREANASGPALLMEDLKAKASWFLDREE